MTKYTITLSRAHKVAERLGQGVTETKTKAEKAAEQVMLQGYTAGQIERLSGNGARALTLLKEQAVLAVAQSKVRAAIGRANAMNGVGDVLTAVEANKKVLSALNGVISAQSNENGVQVSEVAEYKTMGETTSMRSGYIHVSVLTEAQVEELKTEVTRIERENFALSDKLADLNAKTVEIDLEDLTAELVGLKA